MRPLISLFLKKEKRYVKSLIAVPTGYTVTVVCNTFEVICIFHNLLYNGTWKIIQYECIIQNDNVLSSNTDLFYICFFSVFQKQVHLFGTSYVHQDWDPTGHNDKKIRIFGSLK